MKFLPLILLVAGAALVAKQMIGKSTEDKRAYLLSLPDVEQHAKNVFTIMLPEEIDVLYMLETEYISKNRIPASGSDIATKYDALIEKYNLS